jgi:hypothetical protein
VRMQACSRINMYPALLLSCISLKPSVLLACWLCARSLPLQPTPWSAEVTGTSSFPHHQSCWLWLRTHLSPSAQTENDVLAKLPAFPANSHSQNSRASVGGTPSPCVCVWSEMAQPAGLQAPSQALDGHCAQLLQGNLMPLSLPWADTPVHAALAACRLKLTVAGSLPGLNRP